MRFEWPSRVWVEGPDGWVSHEPTQQDVDLRRTVAAEWPFDAKRYAAILEEVEKRQKAREAEAKRNDKTPVAA